MSTGSNSTPLPEQGGFNERLEDELRAKIFHDAEITYEPFTKEDYKTEYIVKINLNNLMKLVRSYTRTLQRQYESELVDRLLAEQIPVIALTSKKPHQEVQIQAVPVGVIEQLVTNQ